MGRTIKGKPAKYNQIAYPILNRLNSLNIIVNVPEKITKRENAPCISKIERNLEDFVLCIKLKRINNPIIQITCLHIFNGGRLKKYETNEPLASININTHSHMILCLYDWIFLRMRCRYLSL